MRLKITLLGGYVLLLFSAAASFAQSASQIASDGLEKWNDGSIRLNNGTELIGQVRFNAFEGILSFQNGKDSRALRAASVQTFEYHDPKTNTQRSYYSLPYEDDVNGTVRPMFFEVLRQFENFAVIAKITPLTAKEVSYQKSQWDPKTNQFTKVRGDKFTTFTKLEYKEKYYVLAEGAKLSEFAEMTFKITNGALFDRKVVRNRITDRKVLKQSFAPHYEAMTKYADENDLEWDERDDMMKLLDYYGRLVNDKLAR